MATTPPPYSAGLEVPPTPMHGAKYDAQELPPRKSTRASLRSQRATTPVKGEGVARRGQAKSYQAISSPPPSVRRSSKKNPKNGRIGDYDMLGLDGTADAAAGNTSLAPPNTQYMLPTPDKTPMKRPVEPIPGIQSVARNIFNTPARNQFSAPTINEATPTPRRKVSKKYNYDTGSFEIQDDKSDIPIFTDSKDRVPELDFSEENPFYSTIGPAYSREPEKRSTTKSKSSKTTGPDEATLSDPKVMVYML
jgi:hypothetical protein